MAKVANNLVTTKLRGMVGGTLVFRSYNGETVVSAAPAPSTKPASEGQQAVREKFRQASLYTGLVKGDPTLLPIYQDAFNQSGNSNFHSFIMTDYLRVPEIPAISSNETASGVLMIIAVANPVPVKSVALSIRDADGNELEAGNAVVAELGKTWQYQVQDSQIPATGIQVLVTATDYPGNVTERSFSV